MARTPLKAIKEYCRKKCRDGSYKERNECVNNECPLHEYRMGIRPNAKPRVRGPMTEEHKAKLQAAAAKARAAKKNTG